MDKEVSPSRDVRRVFSRLSKHSNKKNHHHQQKKQKRQQEFVISGSKREKLRTLSSVVASRGDDQEPEKMGSVRSDVEVELRPSSSSPTLINMKSELPKKFLQDCGTVDHASVPRKLRSAIKNRSCKSISPPLPSPKRRNHSINGFETPTKYGVKKIKLTKQNGSSDSAAKYAVSVPITKDEEEVAEALFALAGMIPGGDIPRKNKLDGEPLGGKTSDLSQNLTDSIPASKDLKDDEVSSTSISDEMTDSNPPIEPAPRGNEKMDSPVHCPTLSEGRGFNLNVDTSPLNHQTTCPTAKSEHLGRRPTQSSICFGIGAQQNAAHVTGKEDNLQPTFECKENDLTLGQGFPSRGSHDPGASGFSIQTVANFPPWPSAAATLSKARSNQYGLPTGVLGIANTQGRSWKRCAAHVYTSRLIQVLKMSEGKGIQTLDPRQMNSREGSKQQFHASSKNLCGGSDGVVSNGRMFVIPLNNNSNDAASDGPRTQDRLHHIVEQGSTSSQVLATNKPNLDFLSLSTSASESGDISNLLRIENSLDHLRVPYLQSLAQQNTFAPFSLPQVRHPSSIYYDQLSTAAAPLPPQQVHLQLPAYFGNSSGPGHAGSTSSRMQQAQLQSQQQQQMWAAQLAAAQWRPGTFPASAPSWRSGRQDALSSTQFMQTPIPTSQSSLESLRSKYAEAPSPQQQQRRQLIALSSSLLHAREKVQQSQIPPNCEHNGGQFRPDGIPPLQLLCTERP